MQWSYLIPVFIVLCFIMCKPSGSKHDEVDSISTDQTLKDITITEALNIIKEDGYTVIDVRTPEEVSKGKIIDSALEMDFYADDFKNKLNALNKEESYVVYCRSGGRSGKTLKMMKDMEFKSVYNIEGGYNAYSELKK